jgi:hypothetical protein
MLNVCSLTLPPALCTAWYHRTTPVASLAPVHWLIATHVLGLSRPVHRPVSCITSSHESTPLWSRCRAHALMTASLGAVPAGLRSDDTAVGDNDVLGDRDRDDDGNSGGTDTGVPLSILRRIGESLPLPRSLLLIGLMGETGDPTALPSTMNAECASATDVSFSGVSAIESGAVMPMPV